MLVVPLHRADLVEAVDGGQSRDDVSAQEGVNVWGGPVLDPDGHVTHHFIG